MGMFSQQTTSATKFPLFVVNTIHWGFAKAVSLRLSCLKANVTLLMSLMTTNMTLFVQSFLIMFVCNVRQMLTSVQMENASK